MLLIYELKKNIKQKVERTSSDKNRERFSEKLNRVRSLGTSRGEKF